MVMMTTKRRDINQDSGETGESITQVRIRVTLDKSSNLAFFIIIIIIITRPKPANGRQGLAGVSLRASGAQLGRGK